MVKHLLPVATALLLLLAPAAAFAQGDPVPVTLEAKASKSAVTPGEQFAVAVVIDHAPGWHVHTNTPEAPPGVDPDNLIATTIALTPPPGVVVWPTHWPLARVEQVAVGPKGPVPYKVFSGRSVAYLPVQASADAVPGSNLEFKITVSYQACNDRTCLLPVEEELRLSLPVVSVAAAASVPRAAHDPDFAAFDSTAFGLAPATGGNAALPKKTITFNVFKWKLVIAPGGAGLVLLLILAAFGGFLLNLTPCVLPVVPLKIMGLSAAAGNPARCLLLGLVSSLGVVSFWLALGGAIAFISGFTAINSLFQTPWFSLGVGVFILFMAAGMLGAYLIQLPQSVYLFNPQHESIHGTFLVGVMIAVLSTPCTAPFMGGAAAWAATQHPSITLATFAAIGFGMALPYIVLSAFPQLVARIPRTGPASELVKQVLGLLLVGVAIFFLGTGLDPLLREPIDEPFLFYWWIIAAAALGAMAWLVVRTFRITPNPRPRLFWTLFAAVFALCSVVIARSVTNRGPIHWTGYTPDRLAVARSEGKVAVLDFTAQWCLNCKAQEAAVLHRREIVALLNDPDVAALKVDLTGNNVQGKQKLKELGWVGIPLLVVYGPGEQEPIKYDAYTPDMVRDAIERAAGPGSPLARRAAVPAVQKSSLRDGGAAAPASIARGADR
jgi:thiol:disulfide interchange protein